MRTARLCPPRRPIRAPIALLCLLVGASAALPPDAHTVTISENNCQFEKYLLISQESLSTGQYQRAAISFTANVTRCSFGGSRLFKLTNLTGLTVTGGIRDSGTHVKITCNSLGALPSNCTGLHLINIDVVKIEGVEFIGCRHPFYSHSSGWLRGHSALYIERCRHVQISRVGVVCSKGTGLVARSVQVLELLDSWFQGNQLPQAESFSSCADNKETVRDENNVTNSNTDNRQNNNNTNNSSTIESTCSGNGSNASENIRLRPDVCPHLAYKGVLVLQGRSVWGEVRLVVNNCTFQNNGAESADDEVLPHEMLPQCKGQRRGGGLSYYTKCAESTVRISDSRFLGNHALYGGGLSIHLNGVHNSTVLVENSVFAENRGQSSNNYSHVRERLESGGGGVQIIVDSFEDAEQQAPNAAGNAVKFSNCTFKENRAYWGGGVSALLARELTVQGPLLHFVGCKWYRNTALFGAGLDIAQLTQQGRPPNVILQGSEIHGNSDQLFDKNTPRPVGAGAVYSDMVDVTFVADNRIHSNKCTGVVMAAATLNLTTDSTTDVAHNLGVNGGGFALYGNARILLHARSTVHVHNNSALLQGGALYHQPLGPRNLMVSQLCFIQYHLPGVPPSQWNVSVIFSCNGARVEGDNIYATSLRTCTWLGTGPYTDGQQQHPWPSTAGPDTSANYTSGMHRYISENMFPYIRITGGEEACAAVRRRSWPVSNTSISTTSQVSNITTETVPLLVYPGELSTQLRTGVKNELGITTGTSVFRGHIKLKGSKTTDVELLSTYVTDMNLRFQGPMLNNFKLILMSPWTQPFAITVDVTLTQCPPGFIYNEDIHQCICSLDTLTRYVGIMRCNRSDDKLYSELRTTYWAGYLDRNKSPCSDEDVQFNRSGCELYTGRSSLGFCGRFRQNDLYTTVSLPSKPSQSMLDQAICSKQNRAGIVCGSCKEGYGLDINSYELVCVSCELNSNARQARAWAQWLTIKYIPLILMVLAFLLFDINILSGSIQMYTIYCQVLSYLAPVFDQSIKLDKMTEYALSFTTTLSDIWRLEFRGNINNRVKPDYPSCFKVNGKGDSLLLVSMDYITAGLPFGIIFVIWFVKYLQEVGLCCKPCNIVLRKCRVWIHSLKRNWTPNSTIIHGLSSFIVLSYTKFLLTSFLLTMPVQLSSRFEGTDGTGIYFYHHVVALDGNIRYASPEHIPFLFMGLFFIFTVVLLPPLILAVLPALPRALVRFQPTRCNSLLKLCDRHCFGPKWQTFLDAFQGSFKPQYSFYSSLFFVYRIGIVLSYSLSPRLDIVYSTLSVGVLCAAILHSIIQPYRRRIHNILDALLYLNMLLIVEFTRSIWTNAQLGIANNEWLWFVLLAMNMPQAVFAVYLASKAVRIVYRCGTKWKTSRRKSHPRKSRECDSEERDNGLLCDSFHNRNNYWETSISTIPEQPTKTHQL